MPNCTFGYACQNAFMLVLYFFYNLAEDARFIFVNTSFRYTLFPSAMC